MVKGIAALVLTGLIAGCGDEGRSGPPDLSKFVGTWAIESGSLTVTCSDGRVQVVPVTDPTTFVLGTTSHLLDTDPACPVRYDVAGNIATAQAGQSCVHPMVITKLNLHDDTFTTTDGLAGTHSGSGTLNGYIDIVMAWPVTCTWTESATYRRAGP